MFTICILYIYVYKAGIKIYTHIYKRQNNRTDSIENLPRLHPQAKKSNAEIEQEAVHAKCLVVECKIYKC